MKVCYLCGGVITGSNQGDAGTVCRTCDVHYCIKCSVTMSGCFSCGDLPERYLETQGGILIDEFKTKRRHDRRELKVPIEYLYAPYDTAYDDIKRANAFSKNISEGGICLFTDIEHTKGDKIKLLECTVCGRNINAQLVWSKQEGERIYKAGFMFI